MMTRYILSEKRTAVTGFSSDDLGHLRYLYEIATQPPDKWDGFLFPRNGVFSYAVRIQLSAASLATAALASKTPAYRETYERIMDYLIQRMLQRKTWNYWRYCSRNLDPIYKNNICFSAYLSNMIGLFEKLTNNFKYDRDFDLVWDKKTKFTYNHHTLAQRIYEQMGENHHHGVQCQIEFVFQACSNFAALSNILHDQLHGTDYSSVNALWKDWARENFINKKPLTKGILYFAYVEFLRKMLKSSENITDVGVLALATPVDWDLVRELYPKITDIVTFEGEDKAFIKSRPMDDFFEVSNESMTTGFGYLLARQMDDEALATKFLNYANTRFGPVWENGKLYYKGARTQLFSTSLFAWGNVISGKEFIDLIHVKREKEFFDLPFVSHVDYPDVYVKRADYNRDSSILTITVAPGDSKGDTGIICSNISSIGGVKKDGVTCNTCEFDGGRLTIRTDMESEHTFEIAC
jgi:Linalool dehydratase/isomerase